MNIASAVIGIFLTGAIIALLLLILKLKERICLLNKAVEDTKNSVDSFTKGQIADIAQIKSDITRDIQDQKTLIEDLKRAKETLIKLDADFQARKEHELKAWSRLEKLENIIAGTQAKGRTGEAIVFEQLNKFPSEMMETRFSPGANKEVEYALILPDQKRLPIDSKFPAEVLQRANELEGKNQADTARKEVEDTIKKKAKEVSDYINPQVTTDVAVCAIPDGAYRYCTTVLSSAYKFNRVIILPYSMLIPFLLAFYRLYLIQFQTHSLDLQKFFSQISGLDKRVDEMSQILKNSIDRSISMLTNASSDFREHLSIIKSALSNIPTIESEKNLEIPQS
jgi:DNA recombination protein RmuC